MAHLDITIDARQVQAVMNAAPVAFVQRLSSLIRGAAIDVEREMRINAPVGATGDMRRAVKHTFNQAKLEAEIKPDTPYALFVEKGTRPHWTSVRPGTALRRWADHKGISPYAVQRSIAMKGTRKHPFVQPTYVKMGPRVRTDVVSGISKFIGEVNNGAV